MWAYLRERERERLILFFKNVKFALTMKTHQNFQHLNAIFFLNVLPALSKLHDISLQMESASGGIHAVFSEAEY